MKKKDVVLFCAAVLLALLKLYLVNCQRMTAWGVGEYDDGLFLELARNIASGTWLGAYNVRSLIKGPVYPAWIALNHQLGIPLLLGAHVLYISACFLVMLFFRKKLDNIRLFLLYLVLLCNPMSFSNGVMTQSLRSNIYPALALMIVGISSGLIFNRDSSVWRNVCLAFFLGVVFSLFWFTREESIWMTPLLSILFIYLIKNKSCGLLGCKKYAGGVSLALITILVFVLSVYALKRVNAHYYGVPVTLEVKSEVFEKAYGSLLRVKDDSSKDMDAVPVPKAVRRKIYQVSPAFRELEPYLEGKKGKFWAEMIYNVRHQLEINSESAKSRRRLELWLQNDRSGIWSHIWDNALKKKDEIYGPFFIWAFRAAVFDAGYSTLPKAMEYYSRLSGEINNACDQGKLECLPLHISLIPPWKKKYLPLLVKTFVGGISYLVTFKEFNPVSDPSCGSQASLDLIRQTTHEKIMPTRARNIASYSKGYRFKLLWGIGAVYHTMAPILAIMGLLGYFLKMLTLKWSILNDDLWIINTGLLASIMLLLCALSYIQITSFPALIARYLAPLYPLMLLFIFLSLNEQATALGRCLFPEK